MKEKIWKEYLVRTRKRLEIWNKDLGNFPCKLLGTTPKVDKGKTQTNGPKDLEIGLYAPGFKS